MDRRPTIGRMDGTALPERKRRVFRKVEEKLSIVGGSTQRLQIAVRRLVVPAQLVAVAIQAGGCGN